MLSGYRNGSLRPLKSIREITAIEKSMSFEALFFDKLERNAKKRIKNTM